MVPSKGPSGDEPIGELLHRLRPEVERLLASYEIPEPEAAELLQEVLVVLSYRWERVADREAWLLATLRRRCQRWCDERDGSAPTS
jgi:DNA-directed RNA polymerase specialized sigma24 family protein